MMLLELREPISAWSHGVGMLAAIGLTWGFWLCCARRPAADGPAAYKPGKTAAMLIFGLSLVFCYGNSSLYHGVWLSGEPLMRLRRLDHVGIYVLIAGTYTPAAWSLMKGSWRRGTLVTVWGVAGFCGARVWFGGILPTWISTLIYLGMGWGVLFCYRELARDLGHRRLLPLPLGGVFYSVGALINLTQLARALAGGLRGPRAVPLPRDRGERLPRGVHAPGGRAGAGPGRLARPGSMAAPRPGCCPFGCRLHCGRRWPPAWGVAGSGSRSSLARPCSAALTSRGKSADKPGGPRARSRPRSSR